MNLPETLHALLFGFPVSGEMIDPAYPAFLQRAGGLCLTLTITFFSLLLGAPLGLALALARGDEGKAGARRSRLANGLLRPARLLARLVADGIRGMPIMILVLLVFYLPYPLFGVRAPGVILAIVAFSLYCGTYLCETFRSGFRAVGSGWLDAARALGLSDRQTLLVVKLPIATRAMIPSLAGLAITILKDTSVLMVVAVGELTFTSRQIMMSEPKKYGLVLILVMAMYSGVATLGSILVGRLERGWGRLEVV